MLSPEQTFSLVLFIIFIYFLLRILKKLRIKPKRRKSIRARKKSKKTMDVDKWDIVEKGKENVLLMNKNKETLRITREEYEQYGPIGEVIEEALINEETYNEDFYLLEYQYSGYPRTYFIDLHRELRRMQGIRGRYHYVPHITLLEISSKKSEKDLIKDVSEIIFKYSKNIRKPGSLVKTGNLIYFGGDKGRGVLAIKILWPTFVNEMIYDLKNFFQSSSSHNFKQYSTTINHTTILLARKNNLTDTQNIKRVYNEQKKKKEIKNMSFILDRISLIKNNKILKEFDLVEETTLDRSKSLNNYKRYKSYLEIKEHLKEKGEVFKSSTKKTQDSEELYSDYNNDFADFD